jgi:hypothetical protein
MISQEILRNLMVMRNYHETNFNNWAEGNIEPVEEADVDRAEGSVIALDDVIKMIRTGQFNPDDWTPEERNY